jgi:SAM-dependent methyltransferase
MSDLPLTISAEPSETTPRRLSSDRMLSFSCPACGRETQFDFRFTKNQCDIRQCTSCGLGRAETAHFDPSTYYTEDYFDGGYVDGYADYKSAEPVLRQEFARTVQFVRRFQASGRLLELGCAYGFFLQEAKRYYTTSGIELAKAAAEHCRSSGLNVLAGPINAANLERLGQQDVIVMLDVIEHLPDPFSTLTLCAHHLDRGGILVVTTGDFGSAVAKVSGKAWRLMTPPQHLWYFTTDSVRRLAARTGLTVEYVDHPWKLVPASLIVFQLKRMLGIDARRSHRGSSFGLPVNLFDAMRVVMRKP